MLKTASLSSLVCCHPPTNRGRDHAPQTRVDVLPSDFHFAKTLVHAPQPIRVRTLANVHFLPLKNNTTSEQTGLPHGYRRELYGDEAAHLLSKEIQVRHKVFLAALRPSKYLLREHINTFISPLAYRANGCIFTQLAVIHTAGRVHIHAGILACTRHHLRWCSYMPYQY
jgi:hypothetical protein